jgi:LysR family glycine cleavage system transcriptional activator
MKKHPETTRPKALPSLNGLRAFEAVGRLGSVSAAAEALHVTPGAVSQRVRELEQAVGVALLKNVGNRVVLTEVGAAAHQPLDAGFRLLQVAVNRMQAQPIDRRLRLTCEPAFAANWLIARLPAWRARPGAVEILLDPSKTVVDIAAREADIGIRFGKGPYDGLQAIRLFEDEIFPVCAPEHLRQAIAAHGAIRGPEDLLQQTLLRLDWKKTGPWPDWEAWLLANGVAVTAVEGPVFHDTGLLLRAAADGQGFALGQGPLVQDMIRDGTLVAPLGGGLKTGFGYYLVYALGMDQQEPIARFRDWLLEEVKRG